MKNSEKCMLDNGFVCNEESEAKKNIGENEVKEMKEERMPPKKERKKTRN